MTGVGGDRLLHNMNEYKTLTTGLGIVYYSVGLPLGGEPPQQSAEVSRDGRNGRRTVGQPVDSFPQLYQGCF